MSPKWTLACALLLHPGICLRLNRSPPKGPHSSWTGRPDKAEVAKLSPSTLEKLSNHNYIFIGDSNEREALFKTFGALGDSWQFDTIGGDLAEDAITGSPKGMGQHLLVVKAPKFNITGIYFFFAGAMTVSPRPAWNVESLDEHPTRKEWLWKHKNGKLVSYEDMVTTYWPKAAKQHLTEDHPTILLTQASLWDAEMSRDFVFKYDKSAMGKEKDQVRFREFNRRASSSSQEFQSWRWTDHVQKHIEMTRDSMEKSGVHLDQVIWRTNPDCVDMGRGKDTDWDLAILEEQAVAIRNLADSKEGIGPGVTLMDWRKGNQNQDMCNKDPHYVQHHYSPQGIANFWNLFAAKMN